MILQNVSLILLKYIESHPVMATQGHLLNKSNVMRYSLSEITYLKSNTMPVQNESQRHFEIHAIYMIGHAMVHTKIIFHSLKMKQFLI